MMTALYLKAVGGTIIRRAAEQGRFVLLDPYGEDFGELNGLTVSGSIDSETVERFSSRLRSAVSDEPSRSWLVCLDITTFLSYGFQEWTRLLITRLAALARETGRLALLVMVASDAALPGPMAALRSLTAGHILTWADGRYQYVQVARTPSAMVSHPMVVVSSTEPPYLDVF